MGDKLIEIVLDYFADLRNIRRLGAGTPERSYYPAFAKLLDAIGAELKGQVLCLSDLGNTGGLGWPQCLPRRRQIGKPEEGYRGPEQRPAWRQAEEGGQRHLACFSFSRLPNTDAYWSNVPACVWDYTLGGYQVIKKWLSYREHAVLGRAATERPA